MTETKRPRAPAGLDAAGKTLWRDLHAAYSFDVWESAVVAAACKQADDVARLEGVITEDGIVTKGSRGQPRIAQALSEARLGRVALARLLSELRLPSDDGASRSARSERGRRAANSRWTRVRQLEDRRDAAAG